MGNKNAMHLAQLDRDAWRQFKDDNNLSKSSFFKKADVGPAIDKFQAALAVWTAKPGKKSLETMFTKSQDLQKAFNKFVALKELKGELDTKARQTVEQWAEDADAFATELAAYWRSKQKTLGEMDATQMHREFKNEFGIG